MSSMPEPLHPVARGLAAPAGSLASYPPVERWDDWETYDAAAWPKKVKRRFALIPTICFNCEAACGLLAYVDKSTGRIEKFEGNPVHPGSRGRNCAKGPATLNQVNDPERIRYPLRRKGARGGGEWERVTWDEALDDIAGRIRSALVDGRPQEVMYHLGRPGHELIYLQRVFHAWGIDGHNSHTNVCSAGARAGYAFWMGFDRPSPDHANARFMLLLSSHLESGHYFNPHAQRIIEGKMQGAKICVIDTRLSNTASMADWWLSPWPGSEAALLLAIARLLVLERRYDRDFVRRWVNWEEYLREERPDLPGTYEGFERALEELYASYTPEFAERESGIPAATIVEIAGEIARVGLGARHARLAQYRGGQPGRLAGGPRAAVPRRPHGRGGDARRHRARRLQQGRARAAHDARAGARVERAADAARVPARVLRDVVPPAAPPEGRARQARHVLHPRLQPGVDQSRRAVVGGDADRRGEGGAPRVPHADLERDGLVRRLRPADGPCLRAPRPHVAGNARRALDRLPPAGAARGAAAARAASSSGRGRRTRRRASARCGRRTSSGSSCRGASIPTAASASASTSSRRTGPGEKLRDRGAVPVDLRALRARPARGRAEGGAHAARVHAQVRLLPHRGRRVRDARQAGRGEGPRGRLRRSRHAGW